MKSTAELLNSLHMLSVAYVAPLGSFSGCRGISHSTGTASSLRLAAGRQQPVNSNHGSLLHTAQPSFQLQNNLHRVAIQLESAALSTYQRPDSPPVEAMAARHIFTAPPHFFVARPPVPCPGPYRPLFAAELTTLVEGDSSPAWNAASAEEAKKHSSADAGTSGFSDGDDEQDLDEELHSGVSTIDQLDEREQAGAVRSHFFKRNCPAGCVERVCPVEGDDKGIGRVGREGCVDRVSSVICAAGDADPSCPKSARSVPMSGSLWRH